MTDYYYAISLHHCINGKKKQNQATFAEIIGLAALRSDWLSQLAVFRSVTAQELALLTQPWPHKLAEVLIEWKLLL